LLFYRFHASGGINLHRTLHLQGTCWRTAAGKIAKGTHQIAIALAADGDSYSGMSQWLRTDQPPCRSCSSASAPAYVGTHHLSVTAPRGTGWVANSRISIQEIKAPENQVM